MAITYDNSATFLLIGSGVTSTSYTCGTNASLLVNTSRKVTSITYNGVSLTNIIDFVPSITDGNEVPIRVWFLANASSGSNTLAFGILSTDDDNIAIVSYTGIDKSGQPEANDTDFSNNGLNNTQVLFLASTITTLTDNAWSVMFTRGGNNFPNVFTAGTGTLRVTYASLFGDSIGIIDNNGPVSPAGNSTLQADWSAGTGYMSNVIMSFAPASPFTGQMMII